MMGSERWTFQIEIHDVLQLEVMNAMLDALNNYLRKRGGAVIIGECELIPSNDNADS